MTDKPLTHETIEGAFKPAADVLTRLPDSVETREAKRLVTVAEGLAHQARERVRGEPS